MERKDTDMTHRSVDIMVALVSLTALGSCLIFFQALLFGLVTALTIAVPFMAWRQGDNEHAKVLLVLLSIIAAAAWTARLEIIISVTLIGIFTYIIWKMRSEGNHYGSYFS